MKARTTANSEIKTPHFFQNWEGHALFDAMPFHANCCHMVLFFNVSLPRGCPLESQVSHYFACILGKKINSLKFFSPLL